MLGSIVRRGGVAAIEGPEAQVVDLGLHILDPPRADRFPKLEDEQLDEFGAGALQVLPEGFGADRRTGDLAQLLGDLVDGRLGVVAAQLQDGGVAVLGSGRLVGLQPRPDAIDDGLAPDMVEVLIRTAGVEQVAGRQGLVLAGPEPIDDQAVEHRPQVVPEATLALVRAGELSGEQLGPELLEDFVGQVLVADLEVNISSNRVVIAADQVLHGGVTLRARRVGATNRRPYCVDVGQPLVAHRSHPR